MKAECCNEPFTEMHWTNDCFFIPCNDPEKQMPGDFALYCMIKQLKEAEKILRKYSHFIDQFVHKEYHAAGVCAQLAETFDTERIRRNLPPLIQGSHHTERVTS